VVGIMPRKDLMDMIRVQIKLEKTTARTIRELEAAISNLAAKLFLAEMRFDTEKHAKILQTMWNLMKQVEPERLARKFWNIETRDYVDALEVRELLKSHVTVETRMLEHVKEEMKSTDDAAVKLLFKHIINDERKHHRILETILDKAFKMVSIP
jgi:rubrerythrin